MAQVFILSALKGEPISTFTTPPDAHKKSLRLLLNLPLARGRVLPAQYGGREGDLSIIIPASLRDKVDFFQPH